jgi:hypothetical protein
MGRKKRARGAFVDAVGVFTAVAILAACGGERSDRLATTTTTRGVTPTLQVVAQQNAALDMNNGIATIAQDKGVSLDEARKFIATQNALTEFADRMSPSRDFVAFGLTEDGTEGILIVSPGSAVRQSPPAGLPVQIREAKATVVEQARLNADLRRDLAQAGFDVEDVGFDFLHDCYVIEVGHDSSVHPVAAFMQARNLVARVASTDGPIGQDAVSLS